MANITELSQLDMDGTYTYADYLTWQFDDALELIKGKIMLMSPAPNVNYQRISMRLSYMLYPFFLIIKNVRFLRHLLMSVYITKISLSSPIKKSSR